MAYEKDIASIINTYNSVIRVVDKNAQEDEERAYGGVIRSVKGRLQEHITHSLVLIAWEEIGGNVNDLDINSNKIPINQQYIETINDQKVRTHIQNNIHDYYYNLSVDKHIFVKGKFAMGIECKAYTENAMLKRILVDFDLLSSLNKNLRCFLFQLESQLGGDYSVLGSSTNYGSQSTHTIMSYFNCKLNIITLLEGERKVNLPIHKHFKPLQEKPLTAAKEILKRHLVEFL